MPVRAKFREDLALRAAIKFANEHGEKLSGEAAFGLFKPFLEGEVPFLYYAKDDWEELRRWLELIHKHDGEAPRTVRAEVAERLKRLQSDKAMEAVLTAGGVWVNLRTVQACCAYAVWVLIRGDGAFGKRLVCCEKCGAFGLNTSHARGRPRRDYCNKEHGKQLRVWKATHKKEEVRKRRRPDGPWQHPYPRRGPRLKGTTYLPQ